jgi:hypothetical protein
MLKSSGVSIDSVFCASKNDGLELSADQIKLSICLSLNTRMPSKIIILYKVSESSIFK